MKSYTFRLPEVLMEQVQAHRKQYGMTASEAIRRAVRVYLEQVQKRGRLVDTVPGVHGDDTATGESTP